MVIKPCWLEGVVFPCCACLTGDLFVKWRFISAAFWVASLFLRCPETQSRVRALTPYSFPTSSEVSNLLLRLTWHGDGRAGCITSAHLGLQDQLQPPLERVCVSSGSSTSSFLQHLVPGQQLQAVTGQKWLHCPPQSSTPGTSAPFMSVLLKELELYFPLAPFHQPDKCRSEWQARGINIIFIMAKRFRKVQQKVVEYCIEWNEYAKG